MGKFRSVLKKFKKELKFYRLVLRDPRTPWYAKVLLGATVGYLTLPIDLIPDFIPVLGQLDDLLIVPLLVLLAVGLVPKQVREECRRAAAKK